MEKNDIKKDNIVILGDSTMKHVDNWQFSRLLKSKNKRAKVIHFSGATTAASKVTSNQHSNEIQNKVIFHSGNNDLRSTIEPIGIASNIMDLAKKVKRKWLQCNYIRNFTKRRQIERESTRSKHRIAWTTWIRKSVDNKTSKF